MDPMTIDADAPRHPGASPEMFDEWLAWQRVVDALTKCSASVDINQERLLASAIEMWGELLVRLRLTQEDEVVDQAVDDKIAHYNTALKR